VPNEQEVLVKVHASTVTRGEAMSVRSDELRITRLLTGIRRPRKTIFGSEFAGRVEKVGSKTSEFKVGDDVFGFRSGALAEYVAVPETGVIDRKPSGLSFEEAAAIPDGSLLALSCLRQANPKGKRVLVYGAAGSVGSSAIQLLAHYFEADVTAVCDTKDVELVRSLGASEVIDRFNKDFTKSGATYDVIFDAVGKQSFRGCRRSLDPAGLYLTMDLGFMYHVPLLAIVTKILGNERAKLGVGRYRKADLGVVRELIENGEFRAVIDRQYTLNEIVAATEYVESGQKTGSVVLTIP
jgi:NADPH:quinone reductase-like Zn-dependent oxidoreductase